MKTILFISPYWKEDHRWMASSPKLADLWQRLGYKVVAVCMGSQTRTERISDTLTVHYRKDIFLSDPWNYGIAFGFGGFVSRLARDMNPDLIVVNKLLFWSSLSVLRLRLSGKRAIVLTDALVGMTWWPRGRIPQVCAALYAWTLGWLILLTAKRVVTFHPQPEKLLKRLGIAGKTQVIPTGIDSDKWPMPSGQPFVKAQDKLSAVSDGVTVTYVGRLESVKGVDDFLEAIVPLKKEFPSLKIQVVGWYKEGHPLVSRFEREVVFTGLRTDIADILAASDMFVLPSHSEGLSNALMEAMSCGCACIASDVGGNRYLLQNGVSGLLFPAGDREALRAHVHRLIEDHAKRAAMGEAANKRIIDHFDWRVVGKMYQTLFEQSAISDQRSV